MEKVEQNDNVNRDELIMQQQREIEKEVRMNPFNAIRYLSDSLKPLIPVIFLLFLFPYCLYLSLALHYLHVYESFHRLANRYRWLVSNCR